MALSRELRRKLLVEDEPLSKRLKLAENTFTSVDLRVTKKEDLVLKWLCQVAEGNTAESKDVWNTLRHCLQFKSETSDVALKSEIKQLLVQTLMAALTSIDDTRLDNVLQCCELLFANCEMQQYFRSKPSCLGELMKALFNIPKCRDESSSRKCTANAVDCFVTCYKQSVNKEEFVDIFVHDILYPLCSLIDKNRNDKLGAEVHKCIQQVLFGKLKYSQFKDYDGNDENNFVSKLFAELRQNTATAQENISIVVFLYCFQAAVGSYKTDPGVIDFIFRNLIDSSGRIKVKLLNCIQEHLSNVTFDYQNKIGDSTLFSYLETFIDEILSRERLETSDYEALAGIALLNPLIVEAKLQAILRKILLETKQTETERSLYEKLMIGILEAETRLRREQSLIPFMLTAVKESVVNHGKKSLEADVAFPGEFKDQFSKSVSNMTTKQTTGLLRSLIFHLNSFCGENSESDKHTMSFLLQANVDLTVAYFKGVRIYDHSVPLAGQEKFVVALSDFGKTIELLTGKVLNLKHNKKMIVSLLTLAWYWDRVFNWIKYYVPEAAPKILEFPISDDRLKQLSDSCDNSGCKRAINRFLVQQMTRNLQEDTRLDVSRLLDGLEESWFIIVDEKPHILSSMDNTQIVEIAHLLLEDVKFSESMQRLTADCVQDNERLVEALVCQIFASISANVVSSITKSVTAHVNVLKILNHGKLSKAFKKIKEDFVKNEWVILDDESTSSIEQALRIMLNLPLSHLSLDLRTLVSLIVYAMKKECGQNNTVSELCSQIMLEVLERMDIDIIDYLEPSLSVQELTQSRVIQRALVSSLRNVSSWETLKSWTKKCETEKESVALLLDCMEKVKSKLKSNQKELFKKAEHKLGKKLLDDVESEINDHKEVRRLTKALKVLPADEEIPKHLIDLVKDTLHRIFAPESSSDEQFLSEGFQLMKIVLNRRSEFELSDESIMHIWTRSMNNPSKEFVQLLLQASKSTVMNKVMNLLHEQTISGLIRPDGTSFTNSLVIWDAFMNMDVGPARNTLRIATIRNTFEALVISEIPAESWPGVLRLVRCIFSKHVYAIREDIDVILLLATRSLKEIGFFACEDVLAICDYLVKFEVGFITDRLPALLIVYGQLVKLIVRESRKEVDSTRERQLRCLALDIAKLTNTLVKLKKDLSRISPNIIAAFVEIFSEGVIPTYVKAPLDDSVGHILSICDQHAFSLLSRALPTSSQGIFKTLYETYNKCYKFTGKI